MNNLAVINLRYYSSRFPGKLLKKINNKLILNWVIDYVKNLNFIKDFIIAIDAEGRNIIINALQKREDYSELKYIVIDKHIRCASERTFEIFKRFQEYDYYISIPSDEPLVNFSAINKTWEEISKIYPSNNRIITLFTRFYKESDLLSNLSSKLVTDDNNLLIYCSRSVVPGSKNSFPLDIYKKHLGITFFSKKFLINHGSSLWGNWYSSLAEIEGLEENRFIEYSVKFNSEVYTQIFETEHKFFGIDTPEQIVEAENRFKEIYN